MGISAKTTHKLHQALGDEAADDVVTWMQAMEEKRIELRELNDLNYARLDARFDAFDARFAAFEARFVAFEAHMESRMNLRFEAFESRVDAKLERRFGESDAKLERRFSDLLKWSFVFWAGSIGAMAVLVRALR